MALKAACCVPQSHGSPYFTPPPTSSPNTQSQQALQLPSGPLWAKITWLWEQPMIRNVRMATSVATWGVRLPAIAALILTQASMLSSQVGIRTRGRLCGCVRSAFSACCFSAALGYSDLAVDNAHAHNAHTGVDRDAGAPAAGYRHAAPLHQSQRRLHHPARRAAVCAAVGVLVCALGRHKNTALHAAAGEELRQRSPCLSCLRCLLFGFNTPLCSFMAHKTAHTHYTNRAASTAA